MTQDLPGSLTDGARRHVADVEARIVRQREILRATQVDRDHKPAALAARALVTMEAEVSLLREHLRKVEELHALE
jgi:transcription elongation GreA/GreB family factor